MAESQLGQLLLAVQLDRLKIFEPTEKDCCPSHASLRTIHGRRHGRLCHQEGINTLELSVGRSHLLYIASVVNRQKSLRCVELSVGNKQHIGDGGLVTALKAAHSFMSAENTP